MNREDIIRMAREADREWDCDRDMVEWLEWFAALVAAAEREACAKVCDDAFDKFFAENEVEFNRQRYDQQAVKRAIQYGVEFVTADCAAAIRARGQK